MDEGAKQEMRGGDWVKCTYRFRFRFITIYISTIIGTGHKTDNWLKHLIRLCHDGMKYITKLIAKIVGVNYSVGFYPRETHIWLAGAEIP